MAFQRKVVGFLSLVVLLLFNACRERGGSDATHVGNPPGATEDVKLAKQAVERTQTSLREVTDVLVKQVALQNSIKNDAQVSEAIREYEALRPEERVRFIVSNDRLRTIFTSAWVEATDNLPATPELRAQLPFLAQQTTSPADFDLTLKKSAVFAQQVKLTNALFKDADPKVLSAVEAWEKLTPEQKRTFTATPENTAYYWNYLYLTYKLQLLRYHWIYTRECYWGYRVPADIRTFDAKQFDLKQGVQQ